MTQNVIEKNYISKPESRISNPVNLVESIKKFITENECPTLSMDISHLNIIDASKVTLICSTFHWAKYPEGEISWRINSPEVRELIKPMNLGNIKLITA